MPRPNDLEGLYEDHTIETVRKARDLGESRNPGAVKATSENMSFYLDYNESPVRHNVVVSLASVAAFEKIGGRTAVEAIGLRKGSRAWHLIRQYNEWV